MLNALILILTANGSANRLARISEVLNGLETEIRDARSVVGEVLGGGPEFIYVLKKSPAANGASTFLEMGMGHCLTSGGEFVPRIQANGFGTLEACKATCLADARCIGSQYDPVWGTGQCQMVFSSSSDAEAAAAEATYADQGFILSIGTAGKTGYTECTSNCDIGGSGGYQNTNCFKRMAPYVPSA